MSIHNYLIFTIVAGSGLLLDQATKLYIDHSMAPQQFQPLSNLLHKIKGRLSKCASKVYSNELGGNR